jgi:hypothetical protein
MRRMIQEMEMSGRSIKQNQHPPHNLLEKIISKTG